MGVSSEIEYAGWKNFSIRENTYPHRRKEFWRTSNTASTMFVFSVIRNVNVVKNSFDSKDLEVVIGCTREGVGFSDVWEDSVKKEDVNLTLFGSHYIESKVVQDLTPKARFFIFF